MPDWNGNFSQSVQAYFFCHNAENKGSDSGKLRNIPSESTFS